jgi:hypothetical protein
LECHLASRHHLLEFGFFLDSINLGFLLREKLADVLIIPSSWGSQLDVTYIINTVPHQLSQKGLNGVGKEKKFMQKSGTKRSLFRLRLRLFHAMLDVF